MAGYSKVGIPNVYDDDEQRSISKADIEAHSQHSNVNVKGYLPSEWTRERESEREKSRDIGEREKASQRFRPG